LKNAEAMIAEYDL